MNCIDTLCEIWEKVLLENKIQVCVEELHGLGLLEVQTMKLVYRHPDYKIKQYLDILNIPNSTFTNMVNRLTKKGFIYRKMDESDLRSFCLELTDLGKIAIEKHLLAEKDKVQELMANLETDEQEILIKLFKKMMQ